MLVMALGMTIAVAPLTTSVLGSVEEQHVAMASGFNSQMGGRGLMHRAKDLLAQAPIDVANEIHRRDSGQGRRIVSVILKAPAAQAGTPHKSNPQVVQRP